MCVWHTGAHARTLCALILLKTHTSFHFLWWMRKCSHKHINKTSVGLSSSLSGPDVYLADPPPLLSSLCLSPGSGPTWLSACFPWRLPASVPRPGGGRWERSLRHILSTPEGWGPAAATPVRRPDRKHLRPNAAHLPFFLLGQEGWKRRDKFSGN